MLVRDRDGRFPGERRFAGEQFVEHHAGGIQITARVDDFTARLLGGEVLRSAHHCLRGGHRRAGVVEGAGDTEVHHLDFTGAGQHHIRWLDVAVHDAVAVRVIEGAEHAGGDFQGSLWQESPTAGEQLPQGHAVDVFHDDVGDDDRIALLIDQGVFTGVIDRDDVRMVQGSG